MELNQDEGKDVSEAKIENKNEASVTTSNDEEAENFNDAKEQRIEEENKDDKVDRVTNDVQGNQKIEAFREVEILLEPTTDDADVEVDTPYKSNIRLKGQVVT